MSNTILYEEITRINKMKKIFIVNGYPLAGKDTFMDYCLAYLTLENRKGVKYSSIDKIKEAASLIGWPGTKTGIDRNFLSALKDLSTQYYDFPLKDIVTFCKISEAEYIFIAVREPEEIRKLLNYFSSTRGLFFAKTILISREGSLTNLTNTGDSLVNNFIYDVEIQNNFSLRDLKEHSNTTIKSLL